MGRIGKLKRQAMQEANKRNLGLLNEITLKESILQDTLTIVGKDSEIENNSDEVVEKFMSILNNKQFQSTGYIPDFGYTYIYPNKETSPVVIAMLQTYKYGIIGQYKITSSVDKEIIVGNLEEQNLGNFEKEIDIALNTLL